MGCGGPSSAPSSDPYADVVSSYPDSGDEIKFLDAAPSNATTDVGLSDLTLTTTSGDSTRVRDLSGKNGSVVVVTRGNTSPICPYCSTQTAQYIRGYDAFRSRGVEVVLVYPIELAANNEKLEAFLNEARTRLGDTQRPVPFPVLFDVALSAVDRLGIRKDLSKPATYIVDGTGQVTYAYVGAHWGDRPSVDAVLRELEQRGFRAETPAAGASAPAVAEPGSGPAEPATPPN